MAITDKIGSGLKAVGQSFVSREVQEKNEQKFSGQVDKAYHKLHVAANNIVGFLKNTAFETLKAPMFRPFEYAQAKKDEEGEVIPLTLFQRTANDHKKILEVTDNAARNAGEIANTLTCKFLSPIVRVSDALNQKNLGSMIQHSVALAVQAVVRAVISVVGQLAHLKTPLKALAYAVLGVITVAIPHVACLMLAIENNKKGKEINALKKEIKEINKPVLQKVKQAISNNKKTAAALLAATLVAGAVYYFGVPSFASNAASTVAGYARSAGSAIGRFVTPANATVAANVTNTTALGNVTSTVIEGDKSRVAAVLSFGKNLLGKVSLKNAAIAVGATAAAGATVSAVRRGAVSKVVNGGKAAIRSIRMPSKKQALLGGVTAALTVGAIAAYLYGIPSFVGSLFQRAAVLPTCPVSDAFATCSLNKTA